ncbi:MAG: FtsW/RodA/SpoVE family cell cycle protein [Clostridia bacterium]|nr:FtsW/RodA/SpoVE family cell cycle protein [Clostridia bacterium]
MRSILRLQRLWHYGTEKGRLDGVLVALIVALVAIGSVMVASASYAYAESRYNDAGYFTRKQILFVILGLFVMLAASRLPPRMLWRLTPAAYGVTVLLLLATLAFGLTGNGAQRWIALGPLTFQPSELAKLTLVLMLARYFTTNEERIGAKGRGSFLYGIVYPLGITGLFCLLVVLQRHLSGLIIIAAIGIGVMFLSGSSKKVLGLLCGAGVAGVGALALTLDYARERVTVWLDPAAYPLEGGWQTLQGMMAIGSGGFFGLGLGNSRLKYSWVSEPANDFIFTITCEELGFLGAALILLLFFLFVRRGYRIALGNEDTFSRIVALGITTKVAIQVLLNVAVITNTIPNTGISLPFFSYGGTSLLVLFLEMGILLSVSRRSVLSYR